MGRKRRTALALGFGALAALTPGAALAAFPGDDGRIAYTRAGDIWTVTPDGADQRQLTTRAVPDADADWSPDGLTVLFSRQDDTGPTVYRIAGDGRSGVESLAPGSQADWSPDGRQIAFVRTLPGDNPHADWAAHEPIFLMNADGTGARQIERTFENTAAPDWGLDRLAFHTGTDDGGTVLRTMDLNGVYLPSIVGQAPIPYPHSANEYDVSDPSWSPDGSRLVARVAENLTGTCAPTATCPNPNVGLTVFARDGSSRTVIPNTSDALDPAWSPDGRRIAFTARRSGQPEIWVTNLDGSGQRRITTGGGSQPDWQPIGPAPRVTSAPGSIPLGSAATALALDGDGFVPRSVVRWNGADRPTTYLGRSRVVVQLTAADLAQPGTGQLTVFTSPSGGGLSAPVPLSVVPPPPPPPPVATIRSASASVRWSRSRPLGRLRVSGSLDRSGRVEIALLKGPAVALRKVLDLPAGAFVRSFPLPTRVVPGRYVVRLREVATQPGIAALTGATRTIRIAAPREGVVSTATISTTGPNGPAATSDPETRRVYARFVFAARPAPGRRIVTEWYRNGRAVPRGKITRPRAARITAVIRSSAPLPSGVWRCVVRAGGTPVAAASIRIG